MNADLFISVTQKIKDEYNKKINILSMFTPISLTFIVLSFLPLDKPIDTYSFITGFCLVVVSLTWLFMYENTNKKFNS